MAGKKKTEAQEPQSLEENFSAVEELIDRVEKQVMKLNEEGGLEPLDPQ